jgi:membrane-bound serine protease (ClpP class)
MGPFEAIDVLIIVGFLMVAEVFVQEWCFCSVAFVLPPSRLRSCYNVVTGSIVFAGVCLLTFTGFVAWLAVFPRTAIGRRIMLQKSLVKGVGERATPSELMGAQGRALTPLRPAGTASIGGRRIDVVAESDFIGRDEPVVVVREEGLRVVVRKKV